MTSSSLFFHISAPVVATMQHPVKTHGISPHHSRYSESWCLKIFSSNETERNESARCISSTTRRKLSRWTRDALLGGPRYQSRPPRGPVSEIRRDHRSSLKPTRPFTSSGWACGHDRWKTNVRNHLRNYPDYHRACRNSDFIRRTRHYINSPLINALIGHFPNACLPPANRLQQRII